MNTRSTEDLLHSWASEYNRGAGWVERLASPDLVWIEHPTPAFPSGRVGDYAALLAAATANLARTPDRRVEEVGIIPGPGNEGAVEWIWRGTAATRDRLEFRGVSLLTFEGDRMTREVDYISYFERPKGAEQYFNPDGTWKT